MAEPLSISDARQNERYAMLRLGLACNVTCPFCNVPWESYPYPMKLTLAQSQKEIDKIIASGVRKIHVSGGEPTLRPELADVVRYARQQGVTAVELQTNGVLLRSRDYVAKLKDAGLTSAFVGLHSHLPKVHDFLVQSPGAFVDCVQGIRHLIEAEIPVTVNPVLTTVNFKTLPDFMRYLARELPGILSVSLSAMQPHGRAWNNWKLLPRYGEMSPYVESGLEVAESLGLPVNNPFCGLPLCIGGWHKRLSRCVEYSESKLGRKPGDGEKVHPEPCRACALKDGCGGIWKEYETIHPVSDLRPIAEAPR